MDARFYPVGLGQVRPGVVALDEVLLASRKPEPRMTETLGRLLTWCIRFDLMNEPMVSTSAGLSVAAPFGRSKSARRWVATEGERSEGDWMDERRYCFSSVR